VTPALLALLLAASQPQDAESVAIAESECYAMVQNGSEVVSTRISGLHVIESTARDGPFAAELPAGTSAILCPRSTIIPAPNDWKVLFAGYPLMIAETAGPPENRRIGALEVSQGQVRFRLISGSFAEGEEEMLRARLNQLQQSARQ